MCVKVPRTMALTEGRTLMKAHRIRKRRAEETIVPMRDCGDRFREIVTRAIIEIIECDEMVPAHEEHFKWPYGPKRDERCEVLVEKHEPFAQLELSSRIVAKQTRVVLVPIVVLRDVFLERLVR